MNNYTTNQTFKKPPKFTRIPEFRDVDWESFYAEWKTLTKEEKNEQPLEIRREVATQSWNKHAFDYFNEKVKLYLLALEVVPEDLDNREMIALKFLELYCNR